MSTSTAETVSASDDARSEARDDAELRRVAWRAADDADMERLVDLEWLVTNGLGGYASSSVAGVMTRKYHGVLVAALPAPLGRVVMLQGVRASVRLPDGSELCLEGDESAGEGLELAGAKHVAEFALEYGLPVWRYELGDLSIEKRVVMPFGQNTVHLCYRLLRSPTGAPATPVELTLSPRIQFRQHEAPVTTPLTPPYALTAIGGRYEITGAEARIPSLRLTVEAPDTTFTVQEHPVTRLLYRVEQHRGYESVGDVWSPGHFKAQLRPEQRVTLIASTEPWETVAALSSDAALGAELERRRRLISLAPEGARDGAAAELVLAADQFIITPRGRQEDAARAKAAGDEVRTVIAGYHWFTDWGRDTMISLEGLTLATGRQREAGYILRTFAHYVRDGLIPNMFPDGSNEGLYHTADASLWFFHAVDRYERASADRRSLETMLPTLVAIAEHHLRGTRFGIGVDPADGLLRQGAQGYQLTWMDAKVDDWVVTPRRGKAVEINALWYNALCLLEAWTRALDGDAAAKRWAEPAARVRESFNRRFWYEAGGHLYDVVDCEAGGDDASIRPNQLFAISLPNPVLDRARWEPVMRVVREKLLTPVGLRSLAPASPDYKPKYFGDLRARDAAYHQGTVWAWLIGPYVDAWTKLHPDDRAGARGLLDGLIAHLDEFGVGSIAEIFDAEAPYTPRGCIAQAWSVAETLRCLLKTTSPNA